MPAVRGAKYTWYSPFALYHHSPNIALPMADPSDAHIDMVDVTVAGRYIDHRRATISAGSECDDLCNWKSIEADRFVDVIGDYTSTTTINAGVYNYRTEVSIDPLDSE
jgi:hypothetical protein